MVLKKLVSFFYNFMDLRGQSGTKDGTVLKLITLEVTGNVEDAVLGSPAESSSALGLDVEGEVCCICLSKMKVEDDMRSLPCLHNFHEVCIDRWFNTCRKTCPVCRFSMGKEEARHKREEQLTEEMVIWFSSFHAAGF